MNRTTLLALFSATALLLLFAVPAANAVESSSTKAQTIKVRLDSLASGVPDQKGSPRPNFGTINGSTVNIHSYEFQGTDPFNDHILDDGNGMRYFSAAGSGFLAAPVNDIPSGVIIDYVEISDCINTAGDIFLGLWSADYGSGSPGAGTNITFVNTAPGCGLDSSSGLGYSYTSNSGNPLWLLMLWSTTFDGTTKFNDVTIGYHRVVSPDPAFATFLDVPVGHPQHQFVEALVAAGITAGCGGGNYCPNNPLTRGQMAVYLSLALGLHWPN